MDPRPKNIYIYLQLRLYVLGAKSIVRSKDKVDSS